MVGPRRKLDCIIFDKKMGVKQDESPRPFVKGNEGPVAQLTFVMRRNRWRLRGPDRDMSRERLDQRESNKLERRRRVGGFGT